MFKSFKKIGCCIAFAACMTTVLSACKQGDNPAGDTGKGSLLASTVPGVHFFSATSTENIMRGAAITGGEDKLYLYAARNETESAQLIIWAEQAVRSYDIVLKDLVHTDGSSKIAKEGVSVFVEHYIETKTPAAGITPMYSPPTGWYPDALIPLDVIVKRRENRIRENENQGLWFNFDIPKDAEAGVYSAVFELEAGGYTQKVPVELRVYDVTLPDENHDFNSYGLWYEYIPFGEGDRCNDETRRDYWNAYYNFLVSKRAMPLELPVEGFVNGDYIPEPEYFANEVVKYADNKRVSSYGLPYRADPNRSVTASSGTVLMQAPNKGSGRYPIADKDYIQSILSAMLAKNIELIEGGNAEADLFKKSYFFMRQIYDETDGNNYGKPTQVKPSDKAVTDAKKAVAQLAISQGYNDLAASIIKIPNIGTLIFGFDPYYYGGDSAGGIQTWCLLLNGYGDDFKNTPRYGGKSGRQIMEERRLLTNYEQGEGFWWYLTGGPGIPYPCYDIDGQLLGARVTKWMQYDYGIEAFLYWQTNFWLDFKTFLKRDMWTDPGGGDGGNGGGSLLYPGAKYNLSAPIGTLRLENIRESGEEWEYFLLLEQQIAALNTQFGKSFSAKNVFLKLTNGMYKYLKPAVEPEDSIKFREKRAALLALLEKSYANPSGAAADIEALLA